MRACMVFLLLATSALAALAQPTAGPADETAPQRQLDLEFEPWTGDFDAMLERRMIRVLVPCSRTLFFVDKGRERGITAELDQLFPGLRDGRGDIAAGNLTVTPKRLELVDFVAPEDVRRVKELIVTGPASPELRTLDDLAGRTVHVRSATARASTR